MILKTFIKQPLEHKDYDVEFAPFLSPIGDTLNEVDTVVTNEEDPSEVSLEVERVILSSTRAKLWIKGGVAGNVYKVTLHVTTVFQRKDESELLFVVENF